MLEKKVLTLAGALGILACGACFLPPLPYHQPAPTPRHVDFTGIHLIRVKVSDVEGKNQVNPADLAQAVAVKINMLGQAAGLSAQAGDLKEGPDATLEISIGNEYVISDSSASEGRLGNWTVTVWTSAVLMKPHGEVMWRDPEVLNKYKANLIASGPEAVWKDPLVHDWESAGLPTRIADRLLIGH
jgi:hypothetical protein